MSIQVNIFNSGSVPTATELANFISELNTDLDSIVTLKTEQVIEGAKTFWGSKMLKFKQKTTADKLGFTFYDNQGKEVGNFEYDNKNNFRLLALGNYYSATNQEIEGHVGFKVYNKSALAAYRLLCPLAGNAKNSIPSLTDTYTNFYMPLIFTNGALSVTADNNGKVDLSTLIGSGGGGGDISGLATVATTGDYNDLLNRPILFSGNYNDLTNKPTLFSGSYGDLTDKPTLFSGDYNDLTNKPTIPTVPTISTNITSDAASDTKTTSPKAVKDFVESKGYLTQHQDISSKADQTNLEALEDRVEALEQSGGSTTQYSYLKLIPDLDAYTEAPVGEIVKYTGQSNSQYTRGWDYECVAGSGTSTTTIQAGSLTLEVPNDSDINPQTGSQYTANPDFVEFMNNNRQPFVYSGSADDLKMWKYKVTAGLGYTPYFLFPDRKTIQVGEHMYSETGGGIAEITEVASNYIKALYNTKSITLSRNAETTRVTRYMYKNADGAILLMDRNSVPNNSTTLFITSYALYDYVNNVHFPGGEFIKIVVHPATETVSHTTPPTWQPIIHPSAPISSGN